jgi:hypothetical protein
MPLEKTMTMRKWMMSLLSLQPGMPLEKTTTMRKWMMSLFSLQPGMPLKKIKLLISKINVHESAVA